MTATVTQLREQDPRIKPGQCGHTTHLAGHEFVCISQPHPTIPLPRHPVTRAYVRMARPWARHHVMIPRYPGGDR
jgi:hypothetical protein